MNQYRESVLLACFALGMLFALISPSSFSAEPILREGSKAIEYVEEFDGSETLAAVEWAQGIKGMTTTLEMGRLKIAYDQGGSYLVRNHLDAGRVAGIDLSTVQDFELSATLRIKARDEGYFGIYWGRLNAKNNSLFLYDPAREITQDGGDSIGEAFSVGQTVNGERRGSDWIRSPLATNENQLKEMRERYHGKVSLLQIEAETKKRQARALDVAFISTENSCEIVADMTSTYRNNWEGPAEELFKKEHPDQFDKLKFNERTLTVRQAGGLLSFMVDGQEVYSSTESPSPVALGQFGVAIQLSADECELGSFVSIDRFTMSSAAESADFARGDEAFKKGYFEVALSHFRPLAEKGNQAGAQLKLGQMYWQGLGVESSVQLAIHWLKQASDQGDFRAQGFLGEAYLTGPESVRDYAKAKALFTKLTATPNAMYNEAAFTLGTMAGMGLGGPKDMREARQWFDLAIIGGIPHPGALHSLGIIYYQGLDGVQDFKKARNYLEQAAEGGTLISLLTLGQIDGRGQGVQIDLIKSYSWFRTASQHMPPGPEKNEAEKSMGQLAVGMTPVQMKQAEEMSRTWLETYGHHYQQY